MESCTQVSTVGTTLLPAAPLTAVRRPVPAPRAQVLVRTGLWRGQGTCPAPAAVAFQGGAIAVSGKAPVTEVTVTDVITTDVMVSDLMITDHPYSTRLGPPSCSPPV